jgi:type I restriction enzyme S subunit
MSFKLTIGRMGFAGQDIYPNEAIVSITPSSGKVIDLFLYYLLGFQDLTAGSGRAIKGETLNSKSLSAIPILLPPLAEQKRIVDLMSSVDSYIEAITSSFSGIKKTVDALNSARKLRSALLSDLLSGNHEIPTSYDSFLGAA